SLPEEYNVWFDWWLWGHLSLSGKFLYIPEKKTKWRIHSSSYNSLNDKKIKNDDNYLERFKVYLKNSLCSCLEQQGQSEFMRYLFREAIYSKKGKEAMLIEQIREIERSKSWRLIQSFRKTRRQITQFPDFLNKFRKVFQHRYCSEKMTRDDNFLYIVLHIPKAAGTTLRMHFENCFGFDRVVSFYEDDDNFENRQQSRDYLRDLSSKDKQKIKMIYGHTACYGLHKYFNRPYRYITFLRDPVDRMISMYNYRMGLFYSKGEWTKEFFTKSGERQKFKDWIEVIPGYKNQLLRILLQDTDFDQNSRSLAEQLEKAKDILRKFWFIGFVEDFKNDSSYLCKELGIPNCQIRKNVTKTKYLAENYEEVRKFVLSFSPIDKEIYDYALALKRNRQRSK
ncbi:MAG: sulfotransferase family 2 domain-containing protein, partial [Candidatus Omnitrophica bacterium]|nr:sulfotransferase family 2 domain-containing protein [Candidatus Omnitrophota bacterium]